MNKRPYSVSDDQVAAVEWFKNQNGEDFIKDHLTPESIDIICNTKKTHDGIISDDISSSSCKVYCIKFDNISLYVGKAYDIELSWLTHCYHIYKDYTNTCTNESYFGVLPSDMDSKLFEFKVLHEPSLSADDLKFKLIDNLEPILQKDMKKYYPSDKSTRKFDRKTHRYRTISRDDVSPDICIKREYRVEAVHDAMNTK